MMKKVISVILALMLISGGICSANGYEVSDWAKSDFEFMDSLGAFEFLSDGVNPKKESGRLEFISLLYAVYNAKSEERYIPPRNMPFKDTISPAAALFYELGIISGDENGSFNPLGNISRQEAAKIICKFYSVLTGKEISDYGHNSRFYFDSDKIAPWAREYIDKMSAIGVMTDCGDNFFCPDSPLTFEQAVVLCSRIISTEGKTDFVKPIGAPILSGGDTRTVTWQDLPDSDEYTVRIIESRNTKHGDEMGTADPVIYVISGEKKITFDVKPVRNYDVTIYSGDKSKTVCVKTGAVCDWSEHLSEIEAYGLPTSAEEAEPLMETITVNVWKLKNGEKVASTASLTVHTAIAAKVSAVFEEIFEGKEQYPIKSLGGYSWRGGKSEHNYGTAIDINPDENYCIYTSGEIVGNYYKPYVDPYSIKPFGEVVEIFEKYGFNWGGDTWTGNRDYMHFSYCGT